MRKVFSIVSILVVAGVVLQFYFAGIGFFSVPEEGLFAIHGTTGRIVLPILFVLSILFAAFARAGKSTIWLTVISVLLLALQTVLFILAGAIFNVGPESAGIPLAATLMVSLHVVNGLAILWVTSIVAVRAFRRAWRPAADATTPTTMAVPSAT